MENNQTQFTSQSQVRRQRKGLNVTLGVIGALLLAAAAAYGVYVWQQNEAVKGKQELQSQIDSLKNQPKDDETKADSYTYTSKIGGLKLMLSKEYPLIVNVDGNKGGAPGSTFKIGKQTSEGVIEDNVYEWVEINIDNLSGTLDQQANIVSTRLKDDSFTNIKIADSKVDDQAAKLITATGISYDAQRRIYLVKSGAFMYEIALKTQDSSKDSAMLKAVLDGIEIEPKELN